MARPRITEILSPEDRSQETFRRAGISVAVTRKTRAQIARERLARLGRGARGVGRGAVVVGRGAVRVGGELAKEEQSIEKELGFNLFGTTGKRRRK